MTKLNHEIHLAEMTDAIIALPCYKRKAMVRGLLETLYWHFDEYGPDHSQFETAEDFWAELVTTAQRYLPEPVVTPLDDDLGENNLDLPEEYRYSK